MIVEIFISAKPEWSNLVGRQAEDLVTFTRVSCGFKSKGLHPIRTGVRLDTLRFAQRSNRTRWDDENPASGAE